MINFSARSVRSLCFAGMLLNTSAFAFQSDAASGQAEAYHFSAVRGVIDHSGATVLKLRLASVDTQNDMRDVRLRFLFFETFQFPEATIRTHVSREDLYALEEQRQTTMTLPFSLDLHGQSRELSATVIATLDEDNSVSVKSAVPVVIRAEDFGLSEGLERLENAFYGEIKPEFPV